MDRSKNLRERQVELVHREVVVLIVLCAIAVGAFFVTRAAAAANRDLRLRDGASWYTTGERDLAGGRPASAIVALRRAVAINRDRKDYQLALARALLANRQDDAARQVLLAVRESSPEDPEVNLPLARLEARRDDVDTAVRYYQDALHGSWDGDDERRLVRVELIQYLLKHDRRGAALAELLVLAGNLPDDGPALDEAGRLFLAVGEPQRSLTFFQRALRIDPQSPTALAGAAEASFDAGDYPRAQRFFRAAARTRSLSARLVELSSITDLVLVQDPLSPRLSTVERRRRLGLDLSAAMTALDRCFDADAAEARASNLEALRAQAFALERTINHPRRRDVQPSVEDGLALIYRIEQTVADECGRPSSLDRALLLIGRRHDLDSQ